MRPHRLLLAAALVLVAAACGSSTKHVAAASTTTSSTTTSTSEVTATTAAAAPTTTATSAPPTATTAKPATTTTAKPQPATTTSAAPTNAAITVKDFSFNPATLRISKGTTVTVTNQDGAAHTWTADDASWTFPLTSGGSASRRFDTAGTFTYHCSIHTSMKGTVVVSG